ncbi:MAG: MBL fold metallo-hydrolase [Coriobacteriales bacterium]|nr:MBL fold metallo-hydrolase [Coriobacteriales bacterium]
MSVDIRRSPQGQAMPRPTVALPPEAFAQTDDTRVYWLGNAGFLINSHGTTVLCDPLLVGFDMPTLVEPPILPEDVPAFDALLYTHIDNDHFARQTLAGLKGKAGEIHATEYVASVARDDEGCTGVVGHAIGENFQVGPMTFTLTPTWHNWQQHMTSDKYRTRTWERKEYCGYWIATPDGTAWLPSDSRPLPEFLEMPAMDMILFDFSDNVWHIGFAGAVELANQYPEADLLPIHWGCVDAPEYTPFNGDPERLAAAITNPERIHTLALGEGLKVRRRH